MPRASRKRKQEQISASGALEISDESTEVVSYQLLALSLGFEHVLSLPLGLTAKHRKGDNLVFYAHRDGLLLVFDTCEELVNTANVYYNWKTKLRPHECGEITSTYSMLGSHTYLGDHDCREGLRRKLTRLRGNGRFLSPWVREPFMWLLTSDDHVDEFGKYKHSDLKALTQERIQLLPRWVRDFMKPNTIK